MALRTKKEFYAEDRPILKRKPAKGEPTPAAKDKATRAKRNATARAKDASIAYEEGGGDRLNQHPITKVRTKPARNPLDLTPIKLSKHQEAFCQAMLTPLITQSAAYRLSNPTSLKWLGNKVAVKATALMQMERVRDRIDQLRAPILAKVQLKAQYNLESAMSEASAALTLAMATDNAGAAVSAITLRAKLNNLLVEQKVVKLGILDGLSFEALTSLRMALEIKVGR